MTTYIYPPVLTRGSIKVDGQTLDLENVEWRAVPGSIRSKAVGDEVFSTAQTYFAERYVDLVIGVDAKDGLPFLDAIIAAPFTKDIQCKIEFAEVRK